MTDETYSIEAARGVLGELIDEAASGSKITITRRGKPVAVIGPIKPTPPLLDRFADLYSYLLTKFEQIEAWKLDPLVLRLQPARTVAQFTSAVATATAYAYEVLPWGNLIEELQLPNPGQPLDSLDVALNEWPDDWRYLLTEVVRKHLQEAKDRLAGYGPAMEQPAHLPLRQAGDSAFINVLEG